MRADKDISSTESTTPTVHYWVGYDCVLSDGKMMRGEPLSPVFKQESQVRNALKRCGRDDAYIVRITEVKRG